MNNHTHATIDASGNWWGSENGPTTPLNTYAYDGITTGGAVIGNATIAPWLTDGADTSTDVGFQPGALDSTPPALPSIPDMTDSSDTGVSFTDNITRTNTPSFSGTADPGTTIALMEGATVLGQTTAALDGTWTIASSTLSDGDHNIFTRSTDQAGNISMSATLTVSIDTASPTINHINDQIVNEDELTILTGTFSDGIGYGPYQEVWHMVSSSNGQSVADVAGDTLTFTPVNPGSYVFSYTVTDVAGNTTFQTVNVTVDDVAPTITVSKLASVATVEEGGVGSQSVTYTYTITNTARRARTR